MALERKSQKILERISEMIKTYLTNKFIMFPLCFMTIFQFFKPRLDLESQPSFTEFWLVIWVSFVIEDFFFYWIHSFIHHPKLYWIHKKHHSQYNTIHIHCVFTHWIEFVFGVALPLLSGLMVLQDKMHMTNLMGLIAFRLIETHESHGGYQFTFSVFQIFPYMVDTAYHNFHHLKNIGNYGTYWIFWDSLFLTNTHYLKRFKKSQQIKNQT